MERVNACWMAVGDDDDDDNVFCCIVTAESTLNPTGPIHLLSSSDHGVYAICIRVRRLWIMSMSRSPQFNHGRCQLIF